MYRHQCVYINCVAFWSYRKVGQTMFHWLRQRIPVPNNNNIAKHKTNYSFHFHLFDSQWKAGQCIFFVLFPVQCTWPQAQKCSAHHKLENSIINFMKNYYYYRPNVIHLKLSPNKVCDILHWKLKCDGHRVVAVVCILDFMIVTVQTTKQMRFLLFSEKSTANSQMLWRDLEDGRRKRSETIHCHRLLIAECSKTFDIQTFRSILELRMTCFFSFVQIQMECEAFNLVPEQSMLHG